MLDNGHLVVVDPSRIYAHHRSMRETGRSILPKYGHKVEYRKATLVEARSRIDLVAKAVTKMLGRPVTSVSLRGLRIQVCRTLAISAESDAKRNELAPRIKRYGPRGRKEFYFLDHAFVYSTTALTCREWHADLALLQGTGPRRGQRRHCGSLSLLLNASACHLWPA